MRASDTESSTKPVVAEGLDRILFDHVRDVVILTDPDWTVLDANRAAHRVLGYDEGDLVGRQAITVIDPEYAEATLARLTKVFTGATDVSPEESGLVTREGDRVPIEVTSTPVIRGGRVIAALCVCRDLSARKATFEALRHSEAMLAESQRIARLGSWAWDAKTDTVTWSDELYRIYGVDRGTFPATYDGFLQRIHPDDRAAVQDRVSRALEDGRSYVGVHRIVRPDGTVRVIESRGTAFADADGSARRLAGTARDVTEEHEANEERRLLRAELVHVHKMEAIGILAGGVAHDFNNALTAIRGYSELVLSELDPSSTAWRDADALRRVAEHAASLPRQLLAFARRQTLQPRELDLGALGTEAEGLLDHVLGSACTVKLERGGAAAWVLCDPGQLQLVLVNLALNARDAMPDGGVFTVQTGVVELDEASAAARNVSPGRYATLVASDTGRGMDAATRARALEPFFSTKEEGTGLGLSTVYGIVTQSGGALLIESEPGLGSRFEISLPAIAAPAVGEAETATATVGDGAGKTVLLVEDEPAVLRVAQRALRRAGYDVLSAGSTADALGHLDAHDGTIDVLVTDVRLPGGDGTELAREVQQRLPSVAVLYVSGYTDEALEPGRAAFLAKPFSPTELVAAVESALVRR